jgi:hypothetical protein
MIHRRKVFLFLCFLLYLPSLNLNAQDHIAFGVIGNGGGKQTSDNFIILGTFGQTGIDISTSSANQIQNGFWYMYTKFDYPLNITLNYSYTFGDVTQTSSYKMIGIPGTNDLPVANLLSGSSGKNGDWRVFWDPGSGGYTEYDGSATFNFIPGRAFWVISKNQLSITDTVNTVNLSVDNSYSIPIHQGWNLISNPFEIPVTWTSVQAINGVTQPIYYYESGSYMSPNPTQLEPYKGYYYDNNSGLSSLKVPYPPGYSGSLPKLNTKLRNEIELLLTLDGARKSSVKIGFTDEANLGVDKLDIFSPPSQFCVINMALYQKELQTIYQYLQEEYRPQIGVGQEFVLMIKNSSEESLNLIPVGLENLREYEVYLFDRLLMKFYDLKNQNTIEIKSSNDEREFSIFIGTKEFIQEKQKALLPTEYVLYQNFPNPFNPTTTIMFALPQQNKVSLKVYNILGELIEKIINDDLYEPGYHQVEFGTSKLVSGVYIYKLVAGNYQSTKKMLLIK